MRLRLLHGFESLHDERTCRLCTWQIFATTIPAVAIFQIVSDREADRPAGGDA